MPSFYEFFAGGGMARAGLGHRWTCLFANDFDKAKGDSYAANWGAEALRIDDVANLKTSDLPKTADLAWASFPCQDLSLAGNYQGIRAERSGVFWPFWKLMLTLRKEGRGVPTVVLENVTGLLTSNNGGDFRDLISCVTAAGYRAGGIVVDAVHFLPQSRPRLFVICTQETVHDSLVSTGPVAPWHPRAISHAVLSWPKRMREQWVWWKVPAPEQPRAILDDLVEDEPSGVEWHSRSETEKLLRMMTEVNRGKVRAAQRSGCRMVGAVYKRTRLGIQRAEVRFDGISGCLRTPAGGSSRQTLLVVEGDRVRSRLISPRELARLMGVPDSYVLPQKYNETYHLFGDGLAVPVVSWIESNLLYPLVRSARAKLAKAA